MVLSEHATVPRWEGDDERDCALQRYVDGDVFADSVRVASHWQDKAEAAQAENARLRGILWGIETLTDTGTDLTQEQAMQINFFAAAGLSIDPGAWCSTQKVVELLREVLGE